VGVFAAHAPPSGSALMARGGDRPVLVRAGEEIAPGIVLNEVHADHVIVLRGAALERIDLERRGAGGVPAQAAGAPAPGATRPGRGTPPAPGPASARGK